MEELRLIDLTKKFGSRTLFSHLSFTMPPAGLVLLRGPSGSGKTTLFRMIAGLDTDYAGTIIGGGAGAVSYAFQEPRLFSHLDALSNVTLALRAAPFSPREGRRRKRLSFPSDMRARISASAPARFRAGCRNALIWRGRWHSPPPSCCSTNPNRGWTVLWSNVCTQKSAPSPENASACSSVMRKVPKRSARTRFCRFLDS